MTPAEGTLLADTIEPRHAALVADYQLQTDVLCALSQQYAALVAALRALEAQMRDHDRVDGPRRHEQAIRQNERQYWADRLAELHKAEQP